MTHTEMEKALNNCDRRLVAIEQILPTLATKADLADVKRELLIRIESMGDKFEILADGFAAHAVKLAKIDVLADDFAAHEVKLDAIGLTLGTLIERLEQKGVI